MDVYVNEMLVKSNCARDHYQHLAVMFDILRKCRMKLNPRKCAFGVSYGKFLSYMGKSERIEANPKKIQAIINMKASARPKQVQSLTGRIAALSLQIGAKLSLTLYEEEKSLNGSQNARTLSTN